MAVGRSSAPGWALWAAGARRPAPSPGRGLVARPELPETRASAVGRGYAPQVAVGRHWAAPESRAKDRPPPVIRRYAMRIGNRLSGPTKFKRRRVAAWASAVAVLAATIGGVVAVASATSSGHHDGHVIQLRTTLTSTTVNSAGNGGPGDVTA